MRRAVKNGKLSDHPLPSKTSTSLEGLGATLPPPRTYILPQKLTARVSPVARGIGGIAPIVLVTGLKLNELVVSITVPPE